MQLQLNDIEPGQIGGCQGAADGGLRAIGEGGQKVQTCSYEMK